MRNGHMKGHARKRRAEGMSINTIVAMAIALIVLGVLLYLAYKYILQTGDNAGQVATTCKGECRDNCLPTESGIYGLGCPATKDAADKRIYCCLPRS